MIIGKRVRLRAIEREDIPNFLRWFNDPEVRQFIQMYAPLSQASEEHWFEEHLARKNDHVFCVEAHIGDEWVPLGNCGLHGIDWKNSVAVFGIVLGEKAHWGKGYGTDAARTMVQFAFDTLNLHRVELEVYDFQPPGHALLREGGLSPRGNPAAGALYQWIVPRRAHDVDLAG